MKNLTQEGTASCDEEAPKIGRLVRMDVGEILQSWGSSSNENGNIPVILGERILYEEPDGTWKKGYVSGIWRTKGGSFYYEIHEVVKPSGDQTPSVPNTTYT